jgi:hypothetical protein
MTSLGLIIAILAVILIGGVLVWQLWPKGKTAPEPAPTLPVDKTANWNLYNNEDYGYQIKYPDHWDMTQCLKSIIFAPKETVENIKETECLAEKGETLTFTINFRTQQQFEEIIMPYRKTSESKKVFSEKVKVDDIESIRYTTQYLVSVAGGFENGDVIVDVLVPCKEGYLEITLLDNQYIDIYNQMIDTFKFTD